MTITEDASRAEVSLSEPDQLEDVKGLVSLLGTMVNYLDVAVSTEAPAYAELHFNKIRGVVDQLAEYLAEEIV